MWRCCAFAAAALAACSGDPVLHVTVTHPSGMTVASTTVSVYASKLFGCQDIEYGNVDANALAAALVASETVSADGTTGALAGLSRADQKIVVARGFDALGNPISAGCATEGEVNGDATLAISTEATAVVSIALVDPTGATDLYGIDVTLTDASGARLDGRQVWWRVYAPAGTPPDAGAHGLVMISDGIWEPAQPSCSKNGVVRIHPAPPSLIGGFAVELRAAWALEPPQFFSSFTRIAAGLTPVTLPPTVSAKYCARHATSASGPRLACLDGSSGSLKVTDYAIGVTQGSTTLTAVQSIAVPADTIALYSVDSGDTSAVYAATATCSTAPLFEATGSHTGACTGADDMVVMPACTGASQKIVFHVPAPGGVGGNKDSLTTLDLATGSYLSQQPAYKGAENRMTLDSAGCVTELESSTPQQMLVVDYSVLTLQPATRAIYHCPGACQSLEMPIPQTNIGFTGGTESRIIVPTIDATGVVLSQDVLLPDKTGSSDHLVERERHPAASLPGQIASGNFDGDNGLDLIWDLATKRGTAFEVEYARDVGTQPLQALSPALLATTDQLVVAELTGDMFDDVVILGRTVETSPKRGVAVIPVHVPAPPISVMTDSDSTCAP